MTAPSVDVEVNSRFKVLERPVLSPGKCAVCGAVDRPVIDFGMDVKFYGAIYLCVTCVSEAAGRVGMIDAATHESEKLQAGQSVADYLLARNLRIITDEQHFALSNLVDISVAADAFGLNGIPTDLDDKDSGAKPRQLRLVLEDDAASDSKPNGDDEPFDL